MTITATSQSWTVEYFASDDAFTIDDIEFNADPISTGAQSGEISSFLLAGDPAQTDAGYAVRMSATVTLDDPEDIALYLTASGDANVYVDGERVLEVRCLNLEGANEGPCPNTGGTLCLCAAENRYDTDTQLVNVASGTHTITIEYLNHLPDEAMTLDWAVGNLGRRPLDLDIPTGPTSNDTDGGGVWDGVEDWPLIGIHAIMTADNQLLTFGTNAAGQQTGEVIYDVWDYETKAHYTLPNTTGTDIFCSVPALIPETGEILIFGGDSRPTGTVNLGVDDANVFDPTDRSLSPLDTGDMDFARWYATAVTLSNGKIVLLGGIDEDGVGVGTPEIYTPGVGFKSLEGAVSEELASGWFYPRAWPTSDGRVAIITNLAKGTMYMLDPSGDGEMEYYGDLPINSGNTLPAVMYAEDKFLIMSYNGTIASVDISGDAPVTTEIDDLGGARNFSNMLLLPTGEVMILGGGSATGVNALGDLYKDVVIWNPETNEIREQDAEALGRLYHSTAILLPDATILSLGGGAPGPFKNTNGEIYRPEYLFNDDGTPADRLVILDAPDKVGQRETFEITVDDPTDVARVTMVKNGSVTHTLNMETRFEDIAYTTRADGTLVLDPPDNANVFTPGAWMIFVFNEAGVPSHAATVMVGLGGEHYMPALGNFVTLSGAAEIISDNHIQLTPEENWMTGNVTTNDRIDFDDDFTLSLEVYLGDSDAADGATILFHNAPHGADATGESAGGLGAQGIANGFGIEFDTWNNDDAEVSHNHTGFFHTNGGLTEIGTHVAVDPLEDGAWHDVVVSWDASAQTISYTLDGVAMGSLTQDLGALYFGDDAAHLSITGATGGANNITSVRVEAFTGYYETDLRGPQLRSDAFVVDEDAALSGNLFANNGNGADSDARGNALSVIAVAGTTGPSVTLGSGAIVTFGADGAFSYDQNGAFDALATGQSDTDSFVYLAENSTGDQSAQLVSITINGADEDDPDPDTPYDPANYDAVLIGDAGDNPLQGSGLNDWIEGRAGRDNIFGGAGNDYIDAGAGNDYFVRGGAGADVFAFNTGSGGIGVYDYEAGLDLIHLTGGLQFEDLTKSFVEWSGITTTIFTAQGGARILLRDTDPDSVGAADFVAGAAPDIPNFAPSANDDSGTTTEGTPIVLAVLDNDMDADGTLAATSVQIIGAPGAGKALNVAGQGQWSVNNDGTIRFAPEDGFAGTATDIAYQVADNDGALSNAATVTVSVSGSAALFDPSFYDTVQIGDAGNNPLQGDGGTDWLEGRGGTDNLFGAGGNDYIDAGAGNDWYVRGGSGADIFAFGAGSGGIKIIDFEDGVDLIHLKDGLTYEDLTGSEITWNNVTTVQFATADGNRLLLQNTQLTDFSISDFAIV